MVRFRVMRPGPFQSHHFHQEARKVLRKYAARIKRDFKRTTRTWVHQPEFKQVTRFSQQEIYLEVYTDDQIYTWVNDGTAPHLIFPVDDVALRFRKDYHPATQPLDLNSRRIWESGRLLYLGAVSHPGIEPRRFDIAVYDKHMGDIQRDIADAFSRAAVMSRHDMGPGSGGRLSPPGGGSPPPSSGGGLRRFFGRVIFGAGTGVIGSNLLGL